MHDETSNAFSRGKHLQEVKKAYSDRSLSLHRPARLKYTILWDLGGCCSGLLACCMPKFERVGSTAARQELGQLRRRVNEQRRSCWEADASGIEVQASMLSGKSWQFVIGKDAEGSEVRELLSELSGISCGELGLVCGGREIRDDEVLFATYGSDLRASPPQIQLLRVFRPLALTCSMDCTMKLWDLDQETCMQTFRGHADGVLSLAVDWAARYAVSGSHDCTLRMWDLDHGICVQEISAAEHPAFCLAFDYHAKLALTGSWDCNLKLWDIERGECVSTLEGHTGPVKVIMLHWPSRLALSGSYDGTLRIWDLAQCICSSTLQGHSDKVYAVDADFHKMRAISGSGDCMMRVWDLKNQACLATLTGHTDIVSAVSIQPGAQRAISGSFDLTVRLWDLDQNLCLSAVNNGFPVICFSVDWTGWRVATCSSQATKLWDFKTGTCNCMLAGHPGNFGLEAREVAQMEAVSAIEISSPSDHVTDALTTTDGLRTV